MLEVRAAAISFGGLQALADVDMAVRPAEIRGLIGPNGAGKSTLLNVICGINRPDRGKVVLNGREIQRMKPCEIARLGVARTFQGVQLFRGMTVLENVMTGLHRHLRAGVVAVALSLTRMREEEAEARQRALNALAFVGIEPFVDRYASDLSFGQQRLVEVARTLVSEPRLLLLDEPAAGLSLPRVEAVDALLRRIRDEKGITIVLVEHVIRLVMGISDRVTVLNYGRVIAEGRPKEVREDPGVIEAYLGKEAVDARGARP